MKNVRAPDLTSASSESTLVSNKNDGLVPKPNGRSKPDKGKDSADKFAQRKAPFIVSTFNTKAGRHASVKQYLQGDARISKCWGLVTVFPSLSPSVRSFPAILDPPLHVIHHTDTMSECRTIVSSRVPQGQRKSSQLNPRCKLTFTYINRSSMAIKPWRGYWV